MRDMALYDTLHAKTLATRKDRPVDDNTVTRHHIPASSRHMDITQSTHTKDDGEVYTYLYLYEYDKNDHLVGSVIIWPEQVNAMKALFAAIPDDVHKEG